MRDRSSVLGGFDGDGRVGEAAIKQGNGTDALLVAATGRDIDSELAVVDGDSMRGPAPVPIMADGSHRVVEG